MGETIPGKDSLEKFRNDPEALALVMKVYQIDEQTAAEVWEKILGTIGKLQAIAQTMEDQADGKNR